MPRRWVVVLVAGAVVVLVVVVVAGVVVGRWLARDTALDRGLTTEPTTTDVSSALAFCGLAELPPGAVAGPLRREQGIDGLVVLRVDGGGVGPWLTGSGLPGPTPSTTTADVEFGPDLPPGTPVMAQHRVQRPGGGIVFRSATLVGPGAVEVRCFET